VRFEGKTEQEAVERALRELGRPAVELSYRVVRDEKSFWGGRVVEIEVEEHAPSVAARPSAAPAETEAARAGATEEDAVAEVEATLTELLSAAGLLLDVRRRPAPGEIVFELSGDDVAPLLASDGEGLLGLEVLTGRISGKRLGRPVYPRLDAEGFREQRRETLELLAHRSAEEAKRTRRPQLLPPLSPGERRLVHLALADDPEVETQSEGDGFLKRVAVRLRQS
jgi:spoIIIJ-associated protein